MTSVKDFPVKEEYGEQFMRGLLLKKCGQSGRFAVSGSVLMAMSLVFSSHGFSQNLPALGLSSAVNSPEVLQSADSLDAYRAAMKQNSGGQKTAPATAESKETVSAEQQPVPVPIPVVTAIESDLSAKPTTISIPDVRPVAEPVATAPIPPQMAKSDPDAANAAPGYSDAPTAPVFSRQYNEQALPTPPAAEEPSDEETETALTDTGAEPPADLPADLPIDSLGAMRVALQTMQSEMDDLKKDLGKKQNKPDTSNKFSCKLGGMLFMDALTVDQSDENRAFYDDDINNQFMVRDVRLSAKGEGYGFLEYECTIGVNRNDINFKDMRLVAKKTPLFGDLTFGYFKVESNMGYVASIYDETFTEFDANTYAFRAARRLGIGSTHYNADQSARLFLGVFTGRDFEKERSVVYADDAGVILNARATAVPIYAESCDGRLCELWHIGAAYYWNRPEDKVNLRVRPSGWAYQMPYLLNGQLPLADKSYSVAEFESAWQKGGFAIQGEGFFGFYEGYDNAYGVSLITRYMLTPGAYRSYNKNRGAFGGVAVPENLRFVDYGNCRVLDGFGAWEIACQWSYTDFDNLKALGENAIYGTANEIMTALNWYWNPQTRLGFNWIHSMPNAGGAQKIGESGDCDTLIAQLRIRF